MLFVGITHKYSGVMGHCDSHTLEWFKEKVLITFGKFKVISKEKESRAPSSRESLFTNEENFFKQPPVGAAPLARIGSCSFLLLQRRLANEFL